jgi:hypothetical protein
VAKQSRRVVLAVVALASCLADVDESRWHETGASTVDARRVDRRADSGSGCPAACTAGCGGGVCRIRCCEGCKCPPGMPCKPECALVSVGAVDCSAATSCQVECAMGTLQVTCGSGPCDVKCLLGCSCAVDCRKACACKVGCMSCERKCPDTCWDGCEPKDDCNHC